MTNKLSAYELLSSLVPGILLIAWIPVCFPSVTSLFAGGGFPEPSSNHWIWTSGGAQDVDLRLANPLSTLSLSYAPSDQCAVCREPEIASVVLSETAHNAILKEVRDSLSAETGGILLGYLDDERHAVILRATGPGPKAPREDHE